MFVIVLLDAFVWFTVRDQSYDRTDATLRAVHARVAAQVRNQRPVNEGLAPQALALGASDYFIEIRRRGDATALAERLRDPALDPPLVPVGAGPDAVTVPSAGDSGPYRLLVRSLPQDRGRLVVAVPLADVDATLRSLLLVAAVGSLGAVLIVAGAVTVLVRRGLRPLEQMAADAEGIAEGALEGRTRPLGGSGQVIEVLSLKRALDTMLGRLQAAFAAELKTQETLRRFVADASHELRTPVAAVLGYADLHAQGAVRGQDEVDRVMERIGHEAQRMQTLVGDLLVLARADEHVKADVVPVDVSAVAHAAAAAAAADPTRTVTVDVVDGVVVPGIEDHVRRVFDNLLVNVRTHTPPGTRAVVRVRRDDDAALLDVEDDGPGIAAGALPHVFDRFYRAEVSRSRSTGGSGLGLSIVRSIVWAHDGTVEAGDRPGGGTRVRVRLPSGESRDAGSG